MNRTRARLVRFLCWLALVFLSLKPLAPVESLVGLADAAVARLSELASPRKLLRRSRVLASERRLAEAVDRELEENARLLRDLAEGALPDEPELLRGRRVVHGEVLGASASSRDRLRVRLADLRGVREGMPVASGNAYVGRVVEVPPGADRSTRATVPGVVLVELVTHPDFHVGARVARETDEVLMTVGGLDDTGRGRRVRRRSELDELRLAVHHPSDRSIETGLARVHELFADAERYSGLAEGLRLGRLSRSAEGRPFLEPELDYEDGLFHVVVLAPEEERLPKESLRDPSLLDSNWLAVTPLSLADPSPWRETARLSAGASDGVRVGAAVTTVGARLIGRIVRVGRWSSTVALLGDPGFSVVAVARFDEEDAPRVLGRLVSTGRERAREGAADERPIRMVWKARTGFDLVPASGAQAASTRRARIYTGSGDSGLESGFFLGEAELPVRAADTDSASGAERRAPTFLLETGLDPRDLGQLFVRLEPSDSLAPYGERQP